MSDDLAHIAQPQPAVAKKNSRLAIVAVVVVILGAGAFKYLDARNAGPSDRSAAIQANIGATSCSSSGYYLTSQLNGSKKIIYDCQMPSGNYKCVTESGGIDTDSTATVRLVFANTLGSTKPQCIS